MIGKLHRQAMNLHQFRFVQEAVRRNLNLTEVAKSLHTSQPGVSKAIIELEEELGIEIFSRHGKRLKRVTEPGQHVLRSIEVILREVGNLKRIGVVWKFKAVGHTASGELEPGGGPLTHRHNTVFERLDAAEVSARLLAD